MRNKILLSSLLLTTLVSVAQAGDMGPVEMYAFKPFVIGEAAYSWPQVSGMNAQVTNIGTVSSNVTVQGWGGRLAAGLARNISERYIISFEGGLVYNDHINMVPVVNKQGITVTASNGVLSGNFDQYGFDMLGGISYSRPKYDLFFKAGALFENLRTKISINSSALLSGNSRQGSFVKGAQQTINVNVGQVMPEIKLGGGYHVNEDWSITAAWMHAFGGKLAFDASNVTLGTPVSIGSISATINNPTIDSVMFGVQYNFS